jgi:hypothetical protein
MVHLRYMNGRYRKAQEIYYTDIDRQDDTDPRSELRAGDLCPVCAMGRLDYDGMLNLNCEQCGFTLVGCFT